MSAHQAHWVCVHCNASGWWSPATHIGPRPDTNHDRPDGKRCLKARIVAVESAEVKR